MLLGGPHPDKADLTPSGSHLVLGPVLKLQKAGMKEGSYFDHLLWPCIVLGTLTRQVLDSAVQEEAPSWPTCSAWVLKGDASGGEASRLPEAAHRGELYSFLCALG